MYYSKKRGRKFKKVCNFINQIFRGNNNVAKEIIDLLEKFIETIVRITADVHL